MDKKFKGFTLIELIIVIAIISILAGMSSLFIKGFVRDSRIETQNEKAYLIYMAFQDMLLDAEIKQDKSLFEGHHQCDSSDIEGAVFYFRISDTDAEGFKNKNGLAGLGDEIHIIAKHSDHPAIPWPATMDPTQTICSYSVWIKDTENTNSEGVPKADYGGKNTDTESDPNGKKGWKQWKKINDYISARMDNSMDGTYAVAVDLVNYQVLSVVCRDLVNGQDPKTGLYDKNEVSDPTKALQNFAYGVFSATDMDGNTVDFPVQTYLIKDVKHEKYIYKQTGICVGAYPFGDSLYTSVYYPGFTP